MHPRAALGLGRLCFGCIGGPDRGVTWGVGGARSGPCSLEEGAKRERASIRRVKPLRNYPLVAGGVSCRAVNRFARPFSVPLASPPHGPNRRAPQVQQSEVGATVWVSSDCRRQWDSTDWPPVPQAIRSSRSVVRPKAYRVTESWVEPLREDDVPSLPPPPATARPWRVGQREGA